MKRFILNLLAKISSFGLASLVAFFLTPFLVSHLGKDVYGFYPLANNFVGYIGVVTLALNSMASRFIILAFMKNDIKKANTYFSSVFFVDLIAIAILIIPLSLFVFFLEHFLQLPPDYTGDIKLLFLLVFVSMFINLASKIFSASVLAKKRVDLHSLVEITQEVCRVLFYVLLFWLFRPHIYLVGLASVLLAITFFVMHFVFTRKLLPELKISFKFFDFSAVKDVFFSGFWGIFNQLGSMLLFTVSLLLANVLLGADALGSLSIVQTVPFLINSFIAAVIVVFYPEMMERYAQKDIPGLISQIRFAQKLIGMTTCIGIAIFIVLGTDFFRLWLPEENAPELQTLSILTILRLAIVACVWPLTYLNIIMNRLKVPALTLIATGILNCVVTVVVLKGTNWGIYAIPVCLATISSLWFIFFLPVYPCKSLGVKWTTFLFPLLRILPLLCVLLGLGYGMSYFFVIDSWVKLIFWSGLLLGVFFSISLFWTFGLSTSIELILRVQKAASRHCRNFLSERPA